MEYFPSTLAGESANSCKSFFLCSVRFLLLIHFPFKAEWWNLADTRRKNPSPRLVQAS